MLLRQAVSAEIFGGHAARFCGRVEEAMKRRRSCVVILQRLNGRPAAPGGALGVSDPLAGSTSAAELQDLRTDRRTNGGWGALIQEEEGKGEMNVRRSKSGRRSTGTLFRLPTVGYYG